MAWPGVRSTARADDIRHRLRGGVRIDPTGAGSAKPAGWAGDRRTRLRHIHTAHHRICDPKPQARSLAVWHSRLWAEPGAVTEYSSVAGRLVSGSPVVALDILARRGCRIANDHLHPLRNAESEDEPRGAPLRRFLGHVLHGRRV